MNLTILAFSIILFVTSSMIMNKYKETDDDDPYVIMARMPLEDIQKMQLMAWSSFFFFFASFFYGG